MYSPVLPGLSVLLMGMLPLMAGSAAQPPVGVQDLSIAAPVQHAAPALTLGRPLTASSALVLDMQSGQEIWGKSESAPHPMASLTKLMTALVTSEDVSPAAVVRVPQAVENTEGSVAHLPVGQRFTVKDLLSALLIVSGNDAAKALAVFHSGSVASFVEHMNRRAEELGLRDTVFANESGLDSPRQHSTARDLAMLAMFVLRRPELRLPMGTAATRIKSLEGQVIALSHTHLMLHQQNSPVLAGKTGTTGAAGQCLISLVHAGDRDYVVVLLDSRDRYADMRVILDALAPASAFSKDPSLSAALPAALLKSAPAHQTEKKPAS